MVIILGSSYILNIPLLQGGGSSQGIGGIGFRAWSLGLGVGPETGHPEANCNC